MPSSNSDWQRFPAKVGRQLAAIFSRVGGVECPPDFEPEAVEIIKAVGRYTMTSPERIYALIRSVEYLAANNIRGDVVECGVWRGGSVMAIARTLLRVDDTNRELYLFDTFEGMPEPSAVDVDYAGRPARSLMARSARSRSASVWATAPLPTVREAVATVGYPASRVHFVVGKVEETVPNQAPERIALLRLDTDWYESTKHELVHLFPRLVPGGVLVLDDYGHWHGARKAVDEYFEGLPFRPLLARVDYTGRIAVVPRGRD